MDDNVLIDVFGMMEPENINVKIIIDEVDSLESRDNKMESKKSVKSVDEDVINLQLVNNKRKSKKRWLVAAAVVVIAIGAALATINVVGGKSVKGFTASIFGNDKKEDNEDNNKSDTSKEEDSDILESYTAKNNDLKMVFNYTYNKDKEQYDIDVEYLGDIDNVIEKDYFDANVYCIHSEKLNIVYGVFFNNDNNKFEAYFINNYDEVRDNTVEINETICGTKVVELGYDTEDGVISLSTKDENFSHLLGHNEMPDVCEYTDSFTFKEEKSGLIINCKLNDKGEYDFTIDDSTIGLEPVQYTDCEGKTQKGDILGGTLMLSECKYDAICKYVYEKKSWEIHTFEKDFSIDDVHCGEGSSTYFKEWDLYITAGYWYDEAVYGEDSSKYIHDFAICDKGGKMLSAYEYRDFVEVK